LFGASIEMIHVKVSFEIRQRDGSPQVMGQVADQELIDQVDGPEDPVDDRQDYGVVVMPAVQDGVDAQDAVYDTMVSVIHT